MAIYTEGSHFFKTISTPLYGIQRLFTSLKNRAIGLLNLISSFNYLFTMKKIVYFLAFTLITSCQKGEKQAKTATSKDTTSVYDTASPSSELTHFATVTTAAASQSRAKKESIDSKSNSLTDKNESEVATEQTDMQPRKRKKKKREREKERDKD